MIFLTRLAGQEPILRFGYIDSQRRPTFGYVFQVTNNFDDSRRIAHELFIDNPVTECDLSGLSREFVIMRLIVFMEAL